MASQDNINLFSQDKFRIALSNLPGMNESQKDLQFLFENYVRSITIPEYTIEYVQSFFKNNVLNNPVSKKNDDLKTFEIEFKLDENFKNYFYLFDYMQSVKYGVPDMPKPSQVRNTRDKSKYLLREYDIDTISILILDNEYRTKKILKFEGCLIESLSNIQLQFGVSEPVPFSVSFRYREVFLDDP